MNYTPSLKLYHDKMFQNVDFLKDNFIFLFQSETVRNFWKSIFGFVTVTLINTPKYNVKTLATFNLSINPHKVRKIQTFTIKVVQILLMYTPSSTAIMSELMATISCLETIFYALKSVFCWANSVHCLHNRSSDEHFYKNCN